MRDVRVDEAGQLRCWNCGSRNFLGKRTGRAHVVGYVTVGIGALATKKKLKCQQCGQYNQVGNAVPYRGPADSKYRPQYDREQEDSATAASPPRTEPTGFSVADELSKLAGLRDAGALTQAEFQNRKAKLLES